MLIMYIAIIIVGIVAVYILFTGEPSQIRYDLICENAKNITQYESCIALENAINQP